MTSPTTLKRRIGRLETGVTPGIPRTEIVRTCKGQTVPDPPVPGVEYVVFDMPDNGRGRVPGPLSLGTFSRVKADGV